MAIGAFAARKLSEYAHTGEANPQGDHEQSE